MDQRSILVDDNSSNSSNSSELIQPERLINDQLFPKQPPRPFINNMRGPPPASFIPVPTDKTTSIYPQLQNYARPGYPRNIQDIISYISPADMKPKYKPEYSRPRPIINTGHHDPFYSYKPKDPSDINLLATANVRFAPPAWKDFKNPIPSPSSQKPVESYPRYETNRLQKGVTLNLNVFPMPNDKYNYYGVASNSVPRFVNYVSDRTKRVLRPRKMIIHLNVYGDDDIERAINVEELTEILTPPPTERD